MSEASTPLPRIDYASHPAYGGMFRPDPALRARAVAALEPLIAEMEQVEAERLQKFGYRYGYEDALGETLVRDSVLVEQLEPRTIDRIGALAEPRLRAMRERLKERIASGAPINFKSVNQVITQDADEDLWNAVAGAMREMKVLDRVTAFFGARSAKLNSLAVFCNPPKQSWIGGRFRDLDVEAPPTAGMHIDSNGKCYLKAILYLNEVGPGQGPTCVVPGSHAWESGSQARIRRRAFDRSSLLGRSPDDRRSFVSLPEELQVKAEFGGDLLAGSEESRSLLEQEMACTGPRGSYALFNPESVHRGGDVREGERHALQITLSARF